MTDKVTPLDPGKRRRPRPLAFERGDQVELGQALVHRLREGGYIVYDDGALYRYSNDAHIFVAVSDAEQSRILQNFAGAPVGEKKRALALKRTDVSGAMHLAWDVVAEPGFFESAPPGIVFRDAFVEVTADGPVPRPHSVEHRARFAYPFDFVPNALPSRFAGFLAEAFRDDGDATDKVRCLQEYMGVSMLGAATRYQRILVVFGPGANGKSVFAAVAEAAMPPGACCAIPPQDWGDEYRLAMLAGKRLNVVSELPEADILATESFKAVVSGDSMTGRHIRQAPFTFRPLAGHIFAGNRLPGTNDQTHGFWRRILVAEFKRIFELNEQDPKLAEKLIEQELPAIASWFLEGAVRVFKNGSYTIPASSTEAVESWKKHADPVRAFVEEATEKLEVSSDPKTWALASDVYRRYRGWASTNGHRTVAANTFGQRMALIGLASKHTAEGNRYPVRLQTYGGDE